MARVVAEIGSDMSKNAPAILGVGEVENRQVLVDLVNQPQLLSKDYGIVHYDSPDTRGIDVALLYQKAIFRPITTSVHELRIIDDLSKRRVRTRDQLLVSGMLEEDLLHIIVNHWPSRRGGEARSRPRRIAAAKLSKRLIDSLQSKDPYAKVILMGDFNDNPDNASIKTVLKAGLERDTVGFKGLYNPYEKMYKQGFGTTGYRDVWSLFDQILLTKPLLERDFSSYRFYKAGIFNKLYLTQQSGRYKAYPFRSFAEGRFTDGFSDHFPVYIYLIKQLEPAALTPRN
jgi:endonuclease/exonuclease/phosphatase family metal-dependent hydrolase